MKKMFVLVVLFSVCLLVALPKVMVYTEEYPPYNYTKDGVVTGISTDIVKKMLETAGIEYELQSTPWARTYNTVLETPNTIIYSIGRNEQRETLFEWGEVIVPYRVSLFKRKDRTEIKVSSYEDLKKYKIGAVKDDVRAQTLIAKGLDSNMDITASDTPNLKKLLAGRIDLVPLDELSGVHQMKMLGLNPDEFVPVFTMEELNGGLYFAFNKDTEPKIIAKCKKALMNMRTDGTLMKIMSKY